MAPPEVYVADADVLIQLYRHFGKDAIRKLRELAQNGVLKLPEGVVREILRGTDRLAEFVKKQRDELEVTFQSRPYLHNELARIERAYGDTILVGTQKYPGFWHSRAGRRSADAQVVAVARSLHAIAVSDDRAVQQACSLEGVPWIGWTEFARRAGLIRYTQLSLEEHTDGDPGPR